ncbi:MAG: hypothetical protein ABII12_11330 [Planctomycetota bacterium]
MPAARVKLVWCLLLLALLLAGCGQQTQAPQETQTQTSKPEAPARPPTEVVPPPKAPPAASQRVENAETAPAPPSRKPKRPKDSWVIFRSAFEEANDVMWDARWTGENRLEVHTDNVQRVTIDMRRLPEGAPTKGPWNLQIDNQGIQITGFRGNVMDIVRSKNGIWTVDRTKPGRRD